MEKIENRSCKQMTFNLNNMPMPGTIKKYYTAIKKVREMTREKQSLRSGRERQQMCSRIQMRGVTNNLVGTTAGTDFMANLAKKYCGLARDHAVENGKRPNGIRDLTFTCLFGLVGAHIGASLLPNGTICGALIGLPIGLHYGAQFIKKRSEKKVEVQKGKQENHPPAPKPKVPKNFSPPPYFFCPGEHGFWCTLADL